ncbi:MAG: TrmH family RNA methyltransferase [Gammaproteobacteria bacterium]|nr:TrmH family RNA methyltransferase [Gammaproteobacteria bacterium]
MHNKQLSHSHHQPQGTKYPLCLLLNDFESPANVGSIFRLADAFGVEKIYLTGSTSVPPNRKMMRTSRATEKFVPYTYSESGLEIVQITEIPRLQNYQSGNYLVKYRH